VTVAATDRHAAWERAGLAEAMRAGALWGVIAAAVMGMYAMIAGLTYLGSGFFTPLYHIASSVIDPTTMMTSMQKAMEGQTSFHLAVGPASVGLIVHLAVGALYGIVFAVAARALRVTGGAAVVAGAVYGAGVLLFSSFVGLPVAAAMFDGGDPIRDMPEIVGWTTFAFEHLLFGVVLGLGWLFVTRSTRLRSEAETR
jgi:hypothetical protein